MSSISAAQFRKRAREGIEMPLPSGNTCLVRPRPGVDVFFQNGFIPNSLMPLVTKALAEGEAAFNIKNLQDRRTGEVPENLLEDMLNTIDRILCFVVLEPKVKPAPIYKDKEGNFVDAQGRPSENAIVIPLDDRDPDAPVDEDGNKIVDHLYADEVDWEDKNFIFGWSMGGTANFERFRTEQNSLMESVQPSQNME
jgi:hypothetical protein